jgi:hypothetical protein
MKPLLLIGAVVLLTSCTKNLTLENPQPTVTIESFKALVANNTFHVTAYSGTIPYPESIDDNIYWFSDSIGTIDSKEPCIQYNVPLRVYDDGGEVKIDWVNLSVQYETYTIKEIGADYFILEGDRQIITYTVKSR